MQNSENDFSPLMVDQQIEHPVTLLPRGEAHLIHQLQSLYDQDNSAAINRVWTRLARQQPEIRTLSPLGQKPENVSFLKQRGTQSTRTNREPRSVSAFARRLSLLAALLVVTLLVGSLALVFTLSRGSTVSSMPINPASGWGKLTYIQTMPDFGFNGLAWSPDSKRVAASNRATTTNLVRIWDATTGQHLIIVPVHTFVDTLAWSPDSQQIAIATDQSVFIADSQTGHIIRALTAPSQASTTFTVSGTALLSSRFPNSGGGGFRALTWSPDGSQIAASSFGETESSVMVWNLRSGATFSLPVKQNNGIEGVSWSSNGKYIAADTFQMTGTDPLSQGGVAVWNVATHQMVLQKATGSLPDLNVVVAWQPGTENLAQIGVVKVGNDYATAILIFNGTTGKTLKQLVVPVSDVLTWSPDGKYLAYTGPADIEKGNTAQVLNTSNWSVVYTYKNDKNIIDELAWSPNGHSIATGETVTGNNTSMGVVRVWTALD